MTTETSIYEYARQGLSYGADRTAVWFYGKSIGYGELFEKIDNVADYLYSLGVREGTAVTIYLPNCPQAVMAIYAVAKLGGICNMVHALTPEAALKENMEFTKSEILISWRKDFAAAPKTAIFVDISDHMGVLFKCGYRLKNKAAKNPAYLSFKTLELPSSEKAVIPEQCLLSGKCVAYFHSSGTTGEPKTVMHCHLAINNWVDNARDFFGKDDMVGESLLAVLPLFHGSGFAMDMHQLISGGGTIVQAAQWNASIAAKWIKKLKITYLTGVPKVYRSLLDQPGFDGRSIKQCYVSGDNVGEKLKLDFNKRVGKEECIFEGYGLTEIVTACFSCGSRHSNIKASGFPLKGCEIAVLTEDGFKRNGQGELLVSANTMMLGYYDGQAEYCEFEGRQWLKTGDIGRIDEEGYVYFIERKKNTIIRNGYDIFPAEIENISLSVDGVDEICVVGIDEKSGTQRVRAYVVSSRDQSNVETVLKKTWAEKLPRYAIPQEIRFIPELPRNRMAKVDRKRLEKL